jgi:hypothetical protein
VFEPPPYVVLGKKQYDQDWIDGNIAAGAGGCGWPAPQPRPPEFDAGKAVSSKVVKPKPSLGARVKAKVQRAVHAAPVAAAPAPPHDPTAAVAEPASVPAPAPASSPDDDDLLEPSGPPRVVVPAPRSGWCFFWGRSC